MPCPDLGSHGRLLLPRGMCRFPLFLMCPALGLWRAACPPVPSTDNSSSCKQVFSALLFDRHWIQCSNDVQRRHTTNQTPLGPFTPPLPRQSKSEPLTQTGAFCRFFPPNFNNTAPVPETGQQMSGYPQRPRGKLQDEVSATWSVLPHTNSCRCN